MIKARKTNVEASWNDDRVDQALVINLANGTLPTDPKHLEVMFLFCTNNWRTYSGEKPQGDKLVSLSQSSLFNEASSMIYGNGCILYILWTFEHSS